MSGKFQFSTLQATYAVNGDFSAADSTIDGYGIGIYAGVGGDVVIRVLGDNSEVTFTAVPQGTFMQVPMFDQVMGTGGGKTSSTDLTIMYMKAPYR